MFNIESSLILLLCLLCVSNPTEELRDSVRGYSIKNRRNNVRDSVRRYISKNRQDNLRDSVRGYSSKNRQDNLREATNAEDPKQGRQASKDTAPSTQTSMIDLTTFSGLPIKYIVAKKEIKEQLVNSNTLPIHANEDSQAEFTQSTKPLLHSLVTDAIDTDDVFQEESEVDKRPEFSRIHFRDEFYCLPCQCYYTFNRSIVASCNSTIIEMNAVLPNDTRKLTIFKSPVRVFRAKDFLRYHSLYNLSVTNNKHMYTIADSSDDTQRLSVKRLDLSSNKIEEIENGSFAMLRNLLSLNLASNKINHVSRMTFEGLANLRFLNLSQNKLSVLTNDSLDHFLNLEVVDLSNNGPHLMLKTGVFSNLRSLHTLFLHGSMIKSKRYPSDEIARLTNLTSLSVDGISSNLSLGPEIKSLRRLVTLYVGFPREEHCNLKVITESFLANVPYLEAVSFSICKLTDVHTNVYKNVPKLRSLEFISTYPYDIIKALDGLRGLQKSSLKSLSLIGLIADGCPFICLYKRHARYLSKLELEVIDLSDNRIGFMDDEFIKRLPPTLRKLVIRGNELTEPALFTDKLFFLQSLETLDLGANTDPGPSGGLLKRQGNSGLSNTQGNSGLSKRQVNNGLSSTQDGRRLPQIQASSGLIMKHMDSDERNFTYDTKLFKDLKSSASGKKVNEEFMYNKIGTPVCNGQLDKNGKQNMGASNINDQIFLPHPPRRFSTTSLKASGLKYLLAPGFSKVNITDLFLNIKQRNYTELTYVDLTFCALHSQTLSTAMPRWIQAINFNGNYISSMQQYVFDDNNSLTYLSLTNNPLGDMFASNIEQIFKKLNNLLYLDLSMNMIYLLDTNVFEGLHNLKMLIMRDNKLGLLNTNFSTTPKLEYLDLRKNSITWISKNTRDDLDIIATNHTLYVELTSNPLRCTCEGLEVLHWIWASNIHFVSKDTLRCIRENGSVEDVGNFEDRVETLQRYCAGRGMIIVLCVASLVVGCFLVVFGVMYRFRWQLRYIRHIALSRLVGFKPRESNSSAYRFDAFIVYSEMSRQFVIGDCLQELEVKRGHKLCVDDRDFMPGTLSVSAIVSAIQNSRKTVLILSPDFYDEEFSEYVVKMALMDEIYQKRPVLYLCVYRPLPDDEMSKSYDLLMVMKRNNYLEYPPQTEINEEVRQCFWDQLSEKIRSSVT